MLFLCWDHIQITVIDFQSSISEGNEYWRTGMATVHGYGYGIRDMGSKFDCI